MGYPMHGGVNQIRWRSIRTMMLMRSMVLPHWLHGEEYRNLQLQERSCMAWGACWSGELELDHDRMVPGYQWQQYPEWQKIKPHAEIAPAEAASDQCSAPCCPSGGLPRLKPRSHPNSKVGVSCSCKTILWMASFILWHMVACAWHYLLGFG